MADKVKGAIRVRILLTWATVSVGVFAIVALSAGGAFVMYGRMYENLMFPGVRVLGVRLDGMTKQESRKAVQDAVDSALSKGLHFRYSGHETVVDATQVAAGPDASRDLVIYNIDPAIDTAFGIGRESGWIRDAMERLRVRIVALNVPVKTTLDTVSIVDAVQKAFRKNVQTPRNAELVINPATSPPLIRVTEEQKGVELVIEPVLITLQRQAERLTFSTLEVHDRVVTPTLTKKDIEAHIPAVSDFLQRPNLTFTYEAQKYLAPVSTFASWVSVSGTRGTLEVTLDSDAFAKGVRELAKGIEKVEKSGNLIIKNGKVESFVAGTEGVTIETEVVRADVLAHWPASSTFPLVVKKTQGSLVGEDPERLGIKDLLGVGRSNFSGSPSNRRKNIAHGAELVNGTLLQPGETFSLLNALGEIDGAHNWLPELVIKGNETKPEFGGGLCQIGTTVFRGALDAGLPIVERRNHSYRVRYYEPVGTDATIYDPKPDFRFMNDTARAVYINAFIKGDDATFEFWGTRDGRTTVFSGQKEVTSISELKPRVFNVTPPPPMKLIETLDLKPGQKKCTEVAHAGADAEFGYTVTYADGTVKKNSFLSHYRPWQAVCLVGVEKLSAPPEATPAEEVGGSPDSAAPVVTNP